MKLSLKAKIIAGLGVLAALCVFGFMTVKLISAQPTGAKYEKFYEASEGVSAEFQKAADLPYSDLGDGLRFVMTDYTEVTFNKTIDLSDPEVKKSFIEFYVIPEVDGEADFKELFFYLYDVNDENNYVKIRLYDATTVVYSQAGANGNSLKGKAHWDDQQIYTDGLWGAATEISFSGYYKSGSQRYLRLQFDNENMQYIFNGRMAVDLDDTEFYTYSQHFKGFSSDQVRVKMVVNGTNKQRADIIITKFGTLTGEELAISEIADTEGPEITVDTSAYAVSDFPVARVGADYPVFDYSAKDNESGLCDVDVSVTCGGETIPVKDGYFPVDREGEYIIAYSSSDRLGNPGRLEKKITSVKDTFPISISIDTDSIEKTMALGEKLTLPEILYVSGYMGKYSAEIRVISKTHSVTVEDGVFEPPAPGVYSVVFGARDILNRFGNLIYEIEVVTANEPIFTSEPVLPKYYIEGYEYTVPCITAYNFATGQDIPVTVWVSADGETPVQLGADGKYTPVSDKETTVFTITYKAEDKVAVYERPLVNVSDSLNQINMYRYFAADGGLTVSANENSALLTAASEGKAEFINPLLAQDLSMAFNAENGKYNFRNLKISLTDSVNENERIEAVVENNGGVATLSLENESVPLSNSFGSGQDFSLTVNKDFIIGDKSIRITEYSDGRAFGGFSSGLVYLEISVSGVYGDSVIYIKNVNGQSLGSRTVRDNIRPRVTVSGDIGGMFETGATVSTLIGFAGDVISPVCDFRLTVTDPEGNIVRDTSGTLLENVSPYRSYDIALSSAGDYVVSYTAEDGAGRTSSTMYFIRSYLQKYISVSDVPENVAVGTEISLPEVTLVNVENTQDYRITVMLIDNLGGCTVLEDSVTSIKLNYAGKYKLIYIAAEAENGKVNAGASLIQTVSITVG